MGVDLFFVPSFFFDIKQVFLEEQYAPLHGKNIFRKDILRIISSFFAVNNINDKISSNKLFCRLNFKTRLKVEDVEVACIYMYKWTYENKKSQGGRNLKSLFWWDHG